LARLKSWIGVLEGDLAATTNANFAHNGVNAGSVATTQSFASSRTSIATSPQAEPSSTPSEVEEGSTPVMSRSSSHHLEVDDRGHPPMLHRLSSASFHTAWEREVALPPTGSDSNAPTPSMTGNSLLPVVNAALDDAEAGLEDWEKILDDQRRTLAEVPVDGLRKLSSRIQQ
jgi:hypothetical protein